MITPLLLLLSQRKNNAWNIFKVTRKSTFYFLTIFIQKTSSSGGDAIRSINRWNLSQSKGQIQKQVFEIKTYIFRIPEGLSSGKSFSSGSLLIGPCTGRSSSFVAVSSSAPSASKSSLKQDVQTFFFI